MYGHRGTPWILSLAFVALAALYSLTNPILESPDEVYHYPYIKQLADGLGLPVQDPEDPGLWEQEGSQPPLYYALGALLTFWIDTDDLSEIRRLNPHAQIGIPLAQDNKNMVLHSPLEAWPWRGTTLAVRLIRLFSIGLGLGTIWCTFAIARRLFPERPQVAELAMALNALNPMFVFISGSVNNDNLIILLSSLTLLALVHGLLRGFPLRSVLLLGVLLGLSALTKLSGLALAPLIVFGLGLRQIQGMLKHRLPSGALSSSPEPLLGSSSPLSDSSPPTRVHGWRMAIRGWLWRSFLVLGIAGAIAGWWYVRNLRLYGDPLGLTAMLDTFGRREHSPSLAEAWEEFRGFRISFWGLFGVVNILLRPLWIYPILDLFCVLCLSGFGLWLAQWLRSANRRTLQPAYWSALALLMVWIGLVGASLLHWTTLTKASQGRLAFPALPAITLFLSVGLFRWVSRRWWSAMEGAVVACFLALTLCAPFTSIRPAYQPPPILASEDEISPSALPFHTSYGHLVELVAYQVEPEVQPGEHLRVDLYWRALAPMDKDYSVYIHLFSPDGRKLGQRDSLAGMGSYPTSRWVPGQIIHDRYLLPVERDVDGPIAADLEVGLYFIEDMTRLPVYDGEGRRVERPLVTRVKIAVPTQPVTPEYALQANFGFAELTGYAIAQNEHTHQLSITLYWQVLERTDHDYTVFVHLVDEKGDLLAQRDAPPLGGGYPTHYWAPGEFIRDVHTMPIAASGREKTRRIILGLYDPQTGDRLPLVDQAGQVVGDHVVISLPDDIKP